MFTTIKQVPSDFFSKVAFDSGVLVKNWDKTAPFTITDAMIIAATTGDFKVSSKPSIIDLFEDVNGVPNGSKEGVFAESWEHTIGVTAINSSLEVIKYALGIADIDTTAGSVTPRLGLADQEKDFVHLTWIGQTVDGGLVVADLQQAMSVEGMEITTGKNTKGQFPLTIKGFYSIEDPDESPVAYYVIEPTYTVTFNSNGGSAVDSQTIEKGGKVTQPTAPEKTGNTFGGWYKDSELTTAWTFGTDTVLKNMTLYAKWTPNT